MVPRQLLRQKLLKLTFHLFESLDVLQNANLKVSKGCLSNLETRMPDKFF